MKLSRILAFLILVLLSFNIKAQNPFESLGRKVKVLTLSNGKYNEFFPNDSLVQVGSVMINTRTRQVLSFVEEDTIYSESGFKPEIVSRWMSPDPLADEFSEWSPYHYAYNNPIIFNDPTGMFGEYYGENGKYLGSDGEDDKKVYAVREGGVLSSTTKDGVTTNVLANSKIVDLGVNIDVFLGFASLINQESGGDKNESYAIGNVTMNYIKEGKSSTLKTLEDVSLYDNSFAQGATQKNYTSFTNMSHEEQNSKSAIGAAINAIGYSKGLSGFSDYSSGANSWDGIDLISTKWPNDHRGYTWSEGSKDLLKEYKTKFNGGVNVSGFTYKTSGYQISATAIVGKTLYTNLGGGRGEHKQSTKRFK